MHQPINNMNCVEKLLESMMKKQIDEFITDNKLIPHSMHGSKKYHNTTTAKLEIDEEVNKQKDNGCNSKY